MAWFFNLCSACYQNNLEIICIDNWSQNFLPDLNPKKFSIKILKNIFQKKYKIENYRKRF